MSQRDKELLNAIIADGGGIIDIGSEIDQRQMPNLRHAGGDSTAHSEFSIRRELALRATICLYTEMAPRFPRVVSPQSLPTEPRAKYLSNDGFRLAAN